jgi:hypothetical protein
VIDVLASDISIRNLSFGPTEPGITAVKVKAGDRTVIAGCTFVGIGEVALAANSADSDGLVIEDNTFTDLDATAIYIGCQDGAAQCVASNVLVHGNLIDGVDSSAVGYGMEIKLDSWGTLSDNVVNDTKGPAIEVYGVAKRDH